jgi:hypothetical protein
MEKKFLALTVVAVAVFLTARSAPADSIRLSDPKLDSSAGFSSSRALDAAVAPSLFSGDFSFRSLLFSELPVFAGVPRGLGADDISVSSNRALDQPSASHLVRRFESDGVGSKPDDSGPTSVPEPASALLAGLGILGLSLFARTNRNKPPFPPIGF